MIEFVIENKEWLFSGVGLLIIGWIYNTRKYFKNILLLKPVGQDLKKNNSTKKFKNKEAVRILFIDDEHTKFRMVSILKKAGWSNTSSLRDVTNLDDFRVKEADIVFVDINGVGTTMFEDQGLGLAKALKEKFPEKRIVIYSAETKGNRFHGALRVVDGALPKDAEPYQFINMIESLCPINISK